MFVKQKNPHLFLTDNIKMNRIPTKIKWKVHTFFPLYLKFWRYLLFVRHSHQIFYLFVFLLASTSAGIIFQKLLDFIQKYLKKYFRRNFFFLTDSLRPPHPLNGQNLLSVTKVYCQCCSLILPNTFDHLTETASPTQFRVDVLSHCDTLPILFCLRF